MSRSTLAIEAVRHIRNIVDWNRVRDIAADLLDDTDDGEAVVQDLGKMLDAALPFGTLVPAPAGIILELIDDMVITLILRPIVKHLMDPERRKAWQEKRKEKVAARRERQLLRAAS